MKNHKRRSLLYSLLLHGIAVVLFILLVVMVGEEKKVVQESRHVVELSHVRVMMPIPTVKKVTPPKKVKPVQKKKVKKKVHKKPIKKKVVTPKVVPVKKAPVIEPIVMEPEVIVEEPVKPEPKEVVVTPTEPATLSPAAVEAVEAPPTPESSPEDIYIKAHISKIMSLLRKNLYYPRMARKRHMEGKVVVRFELLQDGSVKNIVIVEAERDLLGSAAVTTIERLEGKFPQPSEPLLLHVPIMYKLK